MTELITLGNLSSTVQSSDTSLSPIPHLEVKMDLKQEAYLNDLG